MVFEGEAMSGGGTNEDGFAAGLRAAGGALVAVETAGEAADVTEEGSGEEKILNLLLRKDLRGVDLRGLVEGMREGGYWMSELRERGAGER
jgi:hypothetical protein